MNKKYVPVLIGIGVFLFGWLVWPTPYRYDKMNMKWPVRINRFTGTTQVLGMSGWETVGASSSSDSTSSSPNTSNDAPTTVLPSPPQKAQLSCDDVKMVSGQFGSLSVTGIVVNTGDATSLMDIVTVSVYGKDGSILSTGTATVSMIKPGDSQPFQAYIYDLKDSSEVDHVTANVSGS